MALENTNLTEEIETVEVGDIEKAAFFGKKFADMERDELLAAINWLSERNQRIEGKAKEMERKYIKAAEEAGY